MSESATSAPEIVLSLIGVSKRFGPKVVADDLNLDIGRGEFFTFLGPSGSGKSTALRIVAGLEAPDTGTVEIEGRDLTGVPPWRRRVGMVFQQYAIFPHMTVAENVGYGLKVRRQPRTDTAARVNQLLSIVGLDGMGERNVTLLSGGEQQRVALARALAPEPSILLLDEPLSALDEKIRREMQTELKQIQRRTQTTFLYVTHDQEEALTMSDRIAVLHDGRAVQVDRPEIMFRRPRTKFVAHFFRGCNVLKAECSDVAENGVAITLAGHALTAEQNGVQPLPGPVDVAIRAESISVGRAAAERPVQLSARLIQAAYRGANFDYDLELPDGQQLTATSTRREIAEDAGEVAIGFDERDVIVLA